MSRIDFTPFEYYPALQCSLGEHIGYRELSNDAKRQLLPIFELSQKGAALNLDASRAAIRDSAAGSPFILDLCKDAAPPPYVAGNPKDPEADRARYERELAVQISYNAELDRLLNPADGFAEWRKVAATFPSAAPMLQFKDVAAQSRQILRQASLLARGGQSIAIRINQKTGKAIYPLISGIISILESPDQLLIVLDCGHGRIQLSSRAQFAADTIAEILNSLEAAERPLIRAVCMSSSFTSPGGDGCFPYENLDWRLFREAQEAYQFAFGDYAATYRRFRRDTFVPPDFRATVICPLEESWLIHRGENLSDPDGWITGSVAIKTQPGFKNVPDCWGKKLILRAATGDITGIDSARFWHGAKVNIHLTTQGPLAQKYAIGGDDGGEP